MRHLSGRCISLHSRQELSRQTLTQFLIAIPRKEATEILIRQPFENPAQETLDGIRHFACQAAIANRASHRLVQSNCTADTEKGSRRCPSTLIFLPSIPMSAIQCWPQLLGHPVTCNFKCCSNPGSRSSSSCTSQRGSSVSSDGDFTEIQYRCKTTLPRENEDPPIGNSLPRTRSPEPPHSGSAHSRRREGSACWWYATRRKQSGQRRWRRRAFVAMKFVHATQPHQHRNIRPVSAHEFRHDRDRHPWGAFPSAAGSSKSRYVFPFFLKALGSPTMPKEKEFETGAFPVFTELFAREK